MRVYFISDKIRQSIDVWDISVENDEIDEEYG